MNENFFLVLVGSPILLTLMDLKVKVTKIVEIAVAVMMKILKYGMRMWMIFLKMWQMMNLCQNQSDTDHHLHRR